MPRPDKSRSNSGGVGTDVSRVSDQLPSSGPSMCVSPVIPFGEDEVVLQGVGGDDSREGVIPVLRGVIPGRVEHVAAQLDAIHESVNVGDVLHQRAVLLANERAGDDGAISERICEIERIGVRGERRECRDQRRGGEELLHFHLAKPSFGKPELKQRKGSAHAAAAR
jgi:hypothetical protein